MTSRRAGRPVAARVTGRGTAALVALLVGGLALWATPLIGQVTPEGTTITNQAEVSWTDANGNSYTPVSASVQVTVGHVAGVDVSGPATASPNPGSTGNVLSYTLTNAGNGTDSLSVSETISTAGITVTGYRLNGTDYETLAALNAALAALPIAAGGTATVEVIYSVGADQGNVLTNYTLTATSRRGTATDSQLTAITPTQTAGVAVTPDGASVDRLKSNGTQYTETFTVTNNGDGSDTFDLAASADAAKITIVSVNGGTATVTLAAGASTTVDVVYEVIADPGASDVIQLTATSQADSNVSDSGTVTVNVIGADISITKEAYRDNKTTQIVDGNGDRVLPDEYIQYKITVTNNGSADASTVVVTDTVPSQVTLDSESGDGGTPAWTITEPAADQVRAELATLAAGASRFFWIRVQVQ